MTQRVTQRVKDDLRTAVPALGAPVLLLTITQIPRGRSDNSSFPTLVADTPWRFTPWQAGSSLARSGGSLTACGPPY